MQNHDFANKNTTGNSHGRLLSVVSNNDNFLLNADCYAPNSLAILRAARRPSPMARMTVAPPRTMSPPA